MISLVSLEAAKAHLRIDDVEHDFDVESKVAQASEIVMNFYKKSAVPDDWIVNNSPITYEIPQWAQAATLLVAGELYMSREGSVANVLSDAVKSLIPRDPTLA